MTAPRWSSESVPVASPFPSRRTVCACTASISRRRWSPCFADKPGAGQIGTTIGDFATTRIEGTFRLAYLVFNAIMNLTTQDAQAACFENVARHLEPGGSFVVEVMVPDLRRLPPGERYVPFTVSETYVGIDEYDVANQGLISHHYADELRSIPFRYVWPAELDLMARMAGLRLRERWADWMRAPFTGESRSHVSVWERTEREEDDVPHVRL